MSFAPSGTFVLSLEDLIQGLGDTSWVLVEGWEGGTSRRVKSQLPSLGLGHVWGTIYFPSFLWKQAVASLSMTCMKSDPEWFHHFSCPASSETSLVSLRELKKRKKNSPRETSEVLGEEGHEKGWNQSGSDFMQVVEREPTACFHKELGI